jgi:hypothetical protein
MTRRLFCHPIPARGQKGFSVLLIAASLSVMIAFLGLAVDLGRIYIVKTELQAFVDSAAIEAAFSLDGTPAGILNAKNAAANGPSNGSAPNRWHFATLPVTAVQAEFAAGPGGPFSANPPSPAGQRFVRVTASQPISLYFLPVLPNVSYSQPVSAIAVAGQGLTPSIGDGLAPFSPDAHNPLDPNFGFTPGVQYTLKWAPPGQRKKPGGRCPGDPEPFDPGGGASDRGYIDIGQGNGNSALHEAIVNQDFNLPSPLTVGSFIDSVSGNKHVGPAMSDRFWQDTDTVSTSYASYNGNGRRLFIVPVNDAAPAAKVVGFGLFLILQNSCGDNNKPCCAIYVGNSAVIHGTKAGAGNKGLYTVKLFQ